MTFTSSCLSQPGQDGLCCWVRGLRRDARNLGLALSLPLSSPGEAAFFLLVKSQQPRPTCSQTGLPWDPSRKRALGTGEHSSRGTSIGLLPPHPSTRVHSLTLALTCLQSPRLGTGSTPQTLPASLCQGDHMITPSPHSEQQGVTPGEPASPNQPRTLSRLRAWPHTCLQGTGLHLWASQGQVGQAGKSHLADLSHPVSHPEQQLLTSVFRQAPGWTLQKLPPGFLPPPRSHRHPV